MESGSPTPSENVRYCRDGHAAASAATHCPTCGARLSRRIKVKPTLIAVAVALGLAAIAMWLVNRGGGDPPSPVLSPSVTATVACDGLAEFEIGLDDQRAQAPATFCFRVAEPREVTVIAAALEEGVAVRLTLTTQAGVELATVGSAENTEPTITATLEPGLYLGEVTSLDGGALRPYALFTYSLPPGPDISPTYTIPDLPTQAECGTAAVPMLTLGTAAPMPGERFDYACFELTDATRTAIGAATADPFSGEDLRLAVHEFDESGDAQFVRSVDDTFGLDPHLWLSLEPGVYLIEVDTWSGEPAGAFDLKVAREAEWVRASATAATYADVSAAICDTVPILGPGDLATRSGNEPFVCIEVSESGPVVIGAATLGGQDLVMEVITFGTLGEPLRIGWTDDSLYSEQFTDTDPELEFYVPAGRYVIAVATYNGDPLASWDVHWDVVQP